MADTTPPQVDRSPDDGLAGGRHDVRLVKLLPRRAWIFDLDGTLTVAMHDFDVIRAELGLVPNQPILEQLAAMRPAEAAPLHQRLGEMERELADTARPQAGAKQLLEELSRRGTHLGILTRNRGDLAWRTLHATGLAGFFRDGEVLGRDDATPKPSPAGVHLLLDRWGVAAEDAVMVGDYLFDLQAGRSAGTAAVHLDTGGRFVWTEHCDVEVESLNALLDMIVNAWGG